MSQARLRRVAHVMPTLVLISALAACNGGDDARSARSATATASVATVPSPAGSAGTEQTATPAPWEVWIDGAAAPRGAISGIRMVDHVALLVAAKDQIRLAELIQFTERECKVEPPGPGSGPECRSGEPEGTLVPAFFSSGCEGGWGRDAGAIAALIVQRDWELHSVMALDGGELHDAVFIAIPTSTDADGLEQARVTISDQGVVEYRTGCGLSPDPLRVLIYDADRRPELILRGPAYP
jgi:hypothetical protein